MHLLRVSWVRKNKNWFYIECLNLTEFVIQKLFFAYLKFPWLLKHKSVLLSLIKLDMVEFNKTSLLVWLFVDRNLFKILNSMTPLALSISLWSSSNKLRCSFWLLADRHLFGIPNSMKPRCYHASLWLLQRVYIPRL